MPTDTERLTKLEKFLATSGIFGYDACNKVYYWQSADDSFADERPTIIEAIDSITDEAMND